MKNNPLSDAAEALPPVSQTILSTDNRVAGRDYIEHKSNPDIRLLLATEPKESLDQMALKNERFFAKRFGFCANSTVRQQLVTFQNQHDLTDRQITWLKYTGFLHVRRNALRVENSLSVLLFGYFQVIVLSLIFLLSVCNFLFLKHLSPNAWLIMMYTTAGYCALMWVIDRTSLAPRRCLRDRGII